MGGFDDFLRNMAGDMGGHRKRIRDMTPIKGEERADITIAFQPIPNLAPGMKVRWKSEELRNAMFPKLNQIVEIFRVIPEHQKVRIVNTESSGDHRLDDEDFTLLFRNQDGTYCEFPFDSRRFERIKE